MIEFNKESIDRHIYDTIKNLYENECRTITSSCDKIKITRTKFYKICKKYNLPMLIEKHSQSGGSNKNKKNITIDMKNKIKNNKQIKIKLLKKDDSKTDDKKINDKFNSIDLCNNNNINKHLNVYTENNNNNIKSNSNAIESKNKLLGYTDISTNKHKENKSNDEFDIEKLKNIYKIQEFVKNMYNNKILKKQ